MWGCNAPTFFKMRKKTERIIRTLLFLTAVVVSYVSKEVFVTLTFVVIALWLAIVGIGDDDYL